jgi:hypothetical protein
MEQGYLIRVMIILLITQDWVGYLARSPRDLNNDCSLAFYDSKYGGQVDDSAMDWARQGAYSKTGIRSTLMTDERICVEFLKH